MVVLATLVVVAVATAVATASGLAEIPNHPLELEYTYVRNTYIHIVAADFRASVTNRSIEGYPEILPHRTLRCQLLQWQQSLKPCPRGSVPPSSFSP